MLYCDKTERVNENVTEIEEFLFILDAFFSYILSFSSSLFHWFNDVLMYSLGSLLVWFGYIFFLCSSFAIFSFNSLFFGIFICLGFSFDVCIYFPICIFRYCCATSNDMIECRMESIRVYSSKRKEERGPKYIYIHIYIKKETKYRICSYFIEKKNCRSVFYVRFKSSTFHLMSHNMRDKRAWMCSMCCMCMCIFFVCVMHSYLFVVWRNKLFKYSMTFTRFSFFRSLALTQLLWHQTACNHLFIL